jgi:C-terminal processing protease CtpA/Prc
MRWRQPFAVFVAVACLTVAGCDSDPSDVPVATEVPTTQPNTTEAPTSTDGEPAADPADDSTGGEGAVAISGDVVYSNSFFTAGVAEPIVILEDQTGFITRDRNYAFPIESQVLGQITSDFFTSPFSYSVTLPQEPAGTFNDVDNDADADAGVIVYAVAYWTNTWGDSYLEERDQFGGGWSTAYASTRVTDASDAYLEVVGGRYVVFAPDDQQQFPTGFGDDERLFTEDDPVGPLPSGWSVIDLDTQPFAIDQSAHPTVDLIEPEFAALDDFSGLSYTEAFDQMIEKFRNEYAFTEFKDIDWDAMVDEFRPAFEQAESDADPHAYGIAIRDFTWAIPDSHVFVDTFLVDDDFTNETAGGLGLAIAETDAGEVIATFVGEGGPAADAGIELGAEITAFDSEPIGDIVTANVPWSSPFSNPEIKRTQQLRYATRFPLDRGSVDVTYINPGAAPQTAAVDVIEESDSLDASSIYANESLTALPVEFEILPSGVGYIKITSFFDNALLTIQLWERALAYLNDNGITAVVLDMRVNGGGSGWLADQMAAYFFQDRTVTGNTAFYDEVTDDFFIDEGSVAEMIPPGESLIFDGDVAVLVGPGCASACEFFSYDMTLDDRAIVVGHTSTTGAGGSVEQFLMPEDLTVQLTIGRAVDADGKIHLEGSGVVPTLDVPVTFESLIAEAQGDDVVLAAALEALGA